MLKEIKMARNVIRAYCNCLESYFGETNVRSPIIEKPNVWNPIIANFSFLWPKSRRSHWNLIQSKWDCCYVMILNQIHVYIIALTLINLDFSKPKFWLVMILVRQILEPNQSGSLFPVKCVLALAVKEWTIVAGLALRFS